MYDKLAPTLTGELVTLRNINPEQDHEGFYRIFLEPDMHLWTGNRVLDKAEAYEELKKYRDLDGLIAWAVIKKDTNEFIGTYWIGPAELSGKTIITAEAQRIGKDFWRKGYTKEARKLVYHFAFNELKAEEVHAQAWENNVNSCTSMEKAGFKLVKSQEKLFEKRGQAYLENYYILDKNSWKYDSENHFTR